MLAFVFQRLATRKPGLDAEIFVWLFCFLVLRGVKDAAVINYIITIAKVVPILVFIVIAFKADVFADNFWGDANYTASSVWTRRPARC